jgi:uncharacterized membrane protein
MEEEEEEEEEVVVVFFGFLEHFCKVILSLHLSACFLLCKSIIIMSSSSICDQNVFVSKKKKKQKKQKEKKKMKLMMMCFLVFWSISAKQSYLCICLLSFVQIERQQQQHLCSEYFGSDNLWC